METLIAIVSFVLQFLLFSVSVIYSSLPNRNSAFREWEDKVAAYFVLAVEGILVTTVPSLLLTTIHLMMTDKGALYAILAPFVIMITGILSSLGEREERYSDLSLSGIREFSAWRYASLFTK